MKLRTPAAMTRAVRCLCRRVNVHYLPVYVPVRPYPSARKNDPCCNVNHYCEMYGGTAHFGWSIRELPDMYLEASIWAVWCGPAGDLLDVTPMGNGRQHILFLPDAKRSWSGEPIDPVRLPLVDNKFTRFWMALERKKHELRQRHFQNGRIDEAAFASDYMAYLDSLAE